MIKSLLAGLALFLAAGVASAVDVNRATQAELEALSGVGPTIATKIMDERKKAPFKDWSDFIDRVKGVGEGNAAKLSGDGLTVAGATYKGVAAPASKAAPTAKADAKAAPAAAAATAAAPAVAKEAPKKEAAMAASGKDDKAAAKEVKETKATKDVAMKEDKASKSMKDSAAKEDKAEAVAKAKADKAKDKKAADDKKVDDKKAEAKKG